MSDRRQQLVDESAAARAEALALADGLSVEELDRPTDNDGWSVKDTFAHLASIEARVRLMLQTVLDGGVWSADRADLDAYNGRSIAERRSWSPEAVLGELRATGQETAKLFGRLTTDELDREWEHPMFGPMTIERTAGMITRHLRSHVGELRTALQR